MFNFHDDFSDMSFGHDYSELNMYLDGSDQPTPGPSRSQDWCSHSPPEGQASQFGFWPQDYTPLGEAGCQLTDHIPNYFLDGEYCY